MALLDQIARGSTIVLLAVMAFVFIREIRRIPSAGAGVAFFFTIAAYLVLSSPDYVGVRGFDLVLQAATFAAPAAFWLFSRALFEDEGRFTRRDAVIVSLLVAIGFLRLSAAAHPVATVVYYSAGIGLVGLALARVARGFPSDLVERRRRLRAVFTVVVGLEILAILGGEIVLAGDPATRLLETIKSTAALWLTALFAVWFLTPQRDLFAAEPRTAGGPNTTAAAAASAEDARFRERLLALMHGDRVYRQESLTIGVLARKLDLPEYRLRRIINQQLGHRNFNAFLNELRIEDACRILADPAHERLPILNLALDLGYGSPGPFNRAFRAKTGQTPSDYRRARLGESSSAA